MYPKLPINGDGILLREFRAEDAESLAGIEYDPDVKKYMRLPEGERQEWIQRFTPGSMHACEICAIEVLPEQVLAGRASISKMLCTQEKRELQIVIARAFGGRRLGRKAAQILIPAAFEDLDTTAIVGVVNRENQRSLNLLHFFGFEYRGKKECDPDDWQGGHLIYELSRGAYDASLQRRR